VASKDYTTYIPWLLFEAFERGMEIEMRFYYRWVLEPGGTLKWFTEQYVGIAEVTACKLDGYRSVYALRKVSQSLLVDT
jgi:hypothetical protein